MLPATNEKPEIGVNDTNPNQDNANFEFTADADDVEEQERLRKERKRALKSSQPTYGSLLGKARFTFAALSSSLAYFNYCLMEPILA